MPRWKWLKSTKELQEEAFGITFPLEPEPLADYITWNSTALVAELGELLQEVGWKQWATPRGWVNRDQAVKECVDMAHFLANMLVAFNVSDEEWEERYQHKQMLNAERQAEGYDGQSEKCPSCHRALDDIVLHIAPNGDQYCICGYVLKRAEHEVVASIVAPCHHTVPRPPDIGGTITCECGSVWRFIPEHGGRSWKAERVQ